MSQARPINLADYLRQFEHQGGIIVSEQRRFIYMKAPRTGGTSILRRVLEPAIPGIIHKKDHPRAFAKWLAGLTPEMLEEYFIFSFVRNPWDRFVSIACYFELPVQRLAAEFAELQRDRSIRSHSLPLYGYTHCDDVGFVDFVGRFERLQADFDSICNHIGLEPTQLPHASRTNHKHYSRYYDEATKRQVGRLFAQDIDAFDYHFEVM